MATDPDAAGAALLGIRNNANLLQPIVDTTTHSNEVLTINRLVDRVNADGPAIATNQTNIAAAQANITTLQGSVATLQTYPTRVVDANGWTVYDFGTYKQYRKSGSTGITISASGWSPFFFSNLPSGMSTLGSNFIEGACACRDTAVTADIQVPTTATALTFSCTNNFGGGSVTNNIDWSVCITTP